MSEINPISKVFAYVTALVLDIVFFFIVMGLRFIFICIGEKVRVKYDPANPTQVAILSFVVYQPTSSPH